MITLLRNLNEQEVKHANGSLISLLPTGKSSAKVSTGRAAIAHLIDALKLMSTDTVMMPAYVAEGVIQPFTGANIRICFYKLQPNLNPDMSDIRDQLGKDSSIRLCVVVHPLGFEAPIQEVKTLLQNRDIFLFEDCAQGIFSHYQSGGSFGTRGDFALFSLNKFLPVADGAILISNINEVNVEVRHGTTPVSQEEAIASYFQHLRSNNQLLHSDNLDECKRLIEDSGKAYETYYSVISQDLSLYKQSDASKKIESTILYKELIDNRRRNTKLLYEKLDTKKFLPLYEEYHEGIVPMAVPAIVPAKKRSTWIEQLQKRGILLSTLIDKWNFIPQGEEQRYKLEMNYISSHVLIPVSEYISGEGMQNVVTELNKLN